MSLTTTSTNNRADALLAGRWRLDPNRSSVEFRARHFWGLGPVDGRLVASSD